VTPVAAVSRRSVLLRALPWAIPVLLYVVLASRLVGTGVGFQYDEALYVESAVFLLHGDGGAPPFMHDQASWMPVLGKHWPLMIIPYVGTVKALVALPIFAVFGVSAEAARFTGVILGGLGIAGLVVLVRRRAGPTPALLAGLTLAIHSSYLDYTVLDNGGVSVWMGAMGLGALALANYLHRPTIVSAGLLGLAAGLGIWGRANVIWLVATAAVAALLAFGRRAIPPRRHFWSMTAGLAVGSIPLTVYEIRSLFATLRYMTSSRGAWSADLAIRRLRDMAGAMVSDEEHRTLWWGPALRPWEVWVGAGLLALTLLAALLPVRSDEPEAGRWRRAFSVTALLLAGIMISSRLKISPHHLVAVLPLALASVSMLAVELGRRWRRAVPFLAAAGAGFALLLLVRDVQVARGLERTGGRGVFSSGLGDVTAYLKSSPVPPPRLKILDWGFQNSLYVLSSGSVYGTEIFWGATEEASGRGRPWELEIREGGAFLLFQTPSLPASPAALGFRKALEEYRGPRRTKTFFERSGTPLAEVVEIPGGP
jgi:hypothetical protein